MSETIDSVINISETTIDDNRLIAIRSSPNVKKSAENFPLPSFREESNKDYETSDVTKAKHNYLSNSNQDKRNSLQMRIMDNLPTVIKVRSWIVLFVIICLVMLLFQIPIILYYTNPSPDKHFYIPELDTKYCSKKDTLVCN